MFSMSNAAVEKRQTGDEVLRTNSADNSKLIRFERLAGVSVDLLFVRGECRYVINAIDFLMNLTFPIPTYHKKKLSWTNGGIAFEFSLLSRSKFTQSECRSGGNFCVK